MFCDKCGNKLEKNSKFCASCGAQIKSASSLVAPSPKGPEKHAVTTRLVLPTKPILVGLGIILLFAFLWALGVFSPTPYEPGPTSTPYQLSCYGQNGDYCSGNTLYYGAVCNTTAGVYVFKQKECGLKCENSACIATPTPQPIANINDAVQRLGTRPDIADAWKQAAVSANCKARETDITNDMFFAAKLDFDKNLIECQTGSYFSDIQRKTENKEHSNATVQPGIYIYQTTIPEFTSQQLSAMNSCDPLLINEFKKLVNGFSSPYIASAGVSETCKDCKRVFVIYTYCPADNDFTRHPFGFWYADADTGRVYQ